MKYTFEAFWERAPGQLEPLLPLPLTLEFSTVEEARRNFVKVLGHPDFPAHSIKLTSADGAVSERWFMIDGKWRRKDV